MSLTLTALLLAVGWHAVDGSQAESGEDRPKLDGTWIVASVLRDPREPNPDEGKGIRCTIKGEKAVAQMPGELKTVGEWTLILDRGKTPMTMDICPKGESHTIAAIYEIKGETLRVCWSPIGKPRPTEFASKPGSGNTLVELRRAKEPQVPGRSGLQP